MKLTPLIQKAINKSAELHKEQTRKFTGVPYIVHPFSVAIILSEYTNDDRVIASGLLHDVVEDVENYELKDIREEFGKEVAMIVQGVTEIKHKGPNTEEKATWNERKNSYIEKLKSASEESLLVSAADKIHNLQSMIDTYKEFKDEFWKQLHGDAEKQIWFFEEVLKVIKERTDNPIVLEYEKSLTMLKKLIKK